MNWGETGVRVERRTADLDVIANRARSQIVLLNGDYSVALVDFHSDSGLAEKLGITQWNSRLLPEIEQNVREVVDALHKDRTAPNLLVLFQSVVLRVSLLASNTSTMIALFVEPSRVREDLASAAKRYNLTDRQVEVLSYVLQGYSAREIAAFLCISDTTVSDHFKQLLLKTAARNRADMIARVLNWTELREVPTQIP